ncbi:AraC family transcriptional regulator [Chromobacterium alkanivorans]|uniref:AraC family transcriptional regulator n=1 Tax=Chromobacterium alkanivorans TaxID=1071719 RepID=UPI0021686E47|nr:AraC family transcriptional regulator [Chromobacterium alkanivorans]MCS3804204.1 AraC family transcriptional regulator [Chromobacterium alkanivorans]MCS3818576.1 AraC family transcriptional regulator [Chromobacterium alkanivorans]MCS3873489.1 AraC family transcriptional regulator [Chromobacterium alkanivorans]
MPQDTAGPRLDKALAYIDAHLDADLSLERLSRVAACSRFHFHRLFRARFGLSLHQYVRLCRLRRAGERLAFRRCAVLDIALDSGYRSPEAFARAFRQAAGQTPSAFRRQPRWLPWHGQLQTLRQSRRLSMPSSHAPFAVDIIDFPATPVALLEHRGDPALLGDSLRDFIAWRREHRLPPSAAATYNLLYADPDECAPDDYRFGLCAAFAGDIAANRQGVRAALIPAGRCARLRHIGSDDALAAVARRLYAEWLPASGETPRDFPLFLQRVRFYPDVAENEAVCDLFLPLREPAPETERSASLKQ